MRWVTFTSPLTTSDAVGVVADGTVYALRDSRPLAELLGDPEELARAGHEALQRPAGTWALDAVTLRAPVPDPPSVRDFSSFEEHVRTSMEATGQRIDPGWYDNPTFYFSNPAAVKGPFDDVEISPGSADFDFELEVAAVIGTPCGDVSPAEAERHIAGFTLLCDWSARDLQLVEMKQSLGPAKGKDSSTTLGPTLVTPDELEPYRKGNGYDLNMHATVNGETYSQGNWSTIFWSFGQMISYASRGTILRPGDVIGSGTVGSGCILELSRVHGPDRFPYLRPGDDVCLEVEHLGVMRSQVRAARMPVIPLV